MQLGSGTGTSFPTAVDTATAEINAPAAGKTKARAEVINDILSAIVAIETAITPTTATATPTGSKIPIADGDGKLDGWITPRPSVQQVVTEDREIGTVYQNITEWPMFVSASIQSTSANTFGTALTDASSPPTTIVSYVQLTQLGIAHGICFWVLPGNYYEVTVADGTPSVAIWAEWY